MKQNKLRMVFKIFCVICQQRPHITQTGYQCKNQKKPVTVKKPKKTNGRFFQPGTVRASYKNKKGLRFET